MKCVALLLALVAVASATPELELQNLNLAKQLKDVQDKVSSKALEKGDLQTRLKGAITAISALETENTVKQDSLAAVTAEREGALDLHAAWILYDS